MPVRKEDMILRLWNLNLLPYGNLGITVPLEYCMHATAYNRLIP